MVGAALWVASAAYLLPFIDRGWIPHDEGVLGQSAERVLRGELPHRDFQELYTGGLSFLHAAVFRLRGVRIHSTREAFLLFSLLFLPAFYAAALRFGGVFRSAVLTLLVLVWTVPNHFSGMPSWYNLFFATFATLLLFRHAEKGTRWPLFLAGVCSGLAVLVKLHGLFVVAAGALSLVFREESTAPEEQGGRARAFIIAKSAALVLFVVALASVVAKRPAAMEYLHFVVPAAALCGVLIAREARRESGPASSVRLGRLVSLLVPFGAGVALPIAVFLLRYRSDLGGLARGLFAGPSARLTTPRLAVWLPPVSSLVPGLILGAGILILPGLLRTRKSRWMAGVIAAAIAAVLMVASSEDPAYRAVVLSARTLGVVAVLAACAATVRAPGNAGAQKAFVAAAMAAMVMLVQFPFAAPIYLCYAVPPVLLAVAAVLRLRSAEAPATLEPVLAVAAAFFIAFGVFRANVGSPYSFGNRFEPWPVSVPLRLERAGILVTAGEAQVYEPLTAAVREAAAGGAIFAGPDCPEVPFLAAVPSLSPSLVAFLAGPIREPGPHLDLLRSSGARAVVVNRRPDFSPLVSDGVQAELARALPSSRNFGRFTVFSRAVRPSEEAESRMIGAR